VPEAAGLGILPTPSEQGVKEMQELYKRRFDMDLTHAEAEDVLGRIMRFMWLSKSMPIAREDEDDAAPDEAGIRPDDDVVQES
jgi:hypothetical protein